MEFIKLFEDLVNNNIEFQTQYVNKHYVLVIGKLIIYYNKKEDSLYTFVYNDTKIEFDNIYSSAQELISKIMNLAN